MTIFLLIPLLQTPIQDADKFNNFLIFGFVVMWLIGLAYLLYLHNRQRNVSQDLDLLQRVLDEQEW